MRAYLGGDLGARLRALADGWLRPVHRLLVSAAPDTSPSQSADRLDGYRQALEEHFCITVTDPSGRLLEVNDRFCQVIGYAESELVGKPYEMLSSGRQTGETLTEMWETVHSGKTWRGELCDRAKNGADVCFESIVIPRFNCAGKIERFITISTDITAIRQQAQALQATIDNFPGGLALIDRELRLVACNRLYRTLLDLPDPFFMGEPPKLETLVRYRAERGDYGPDGGRGDCQRAAEDAAEPGADHHGTQRALGPRSGDPLRSR